MQRADVRRGSGEPHPVLVPDVSREVLSPGTTRPASSPGGRAGRTLSGERTSRTSDEHPAGVHLYFEIADDQAIAGVGRAADAAAMRWRNWAAIRASSSARRKGLVT